MKTPKHPFPQRPTQGPRPKQAAPAPRPPTPANARPSVAQPKLAQPKVSGPRPAPKAPPVYRPQPVPLVLQRKSALPAPPAPQTAKTPKAPPVYRPEPRHVQTKPALQAKPAVPARPNVQARPAPTPPRPNPPAVRPARPVVQRKVSLGDYDGGVPIGPSVTDQDATNFLNHLRNEGMGATDIGTVKDLMKESFRTYQFDDIDHLFDYLDDVGDEPEIDEEMEDATVVNGLAQDFGTNFKGKNIPFSGSRVYAVAHTSGSEALWGMQNSATGNVPKAKQQIVKNWAPKSNLPIEFPSNTKASIEKMGKKRPTVLTSNAHAEVNEFVQHAYFALMRAHHSPHDLSITIASDIAHCVECWWAGNAMMLKGTGQIVSHTGCANKLFERWREPWVGFYTEYGDNPFRKSNGDLKNGLSAGVYSAGQLNARMPPRLNGIYT
jgi:hypothetical protein